MIKKYLNVFWAFFIPFFVLFLVFFAKDLIFGSKVVFISDLQAQYAPLHAYLMDVFKGEESLFYSFSKGIGGNMMSTFAYYLASPLTFILIFFSEVNLYNGILLLIMLKLSLSSLFMYLFLKEHINKNNFLLIAFSTIYALSGYSVAYFINIMWLDVVMLAPLVLLGVDKIINGKRSILYAIAIFMAIFSQYYMAYMLCVFTVIYFIYRLFIKYEVFKNMDKVIPLVFKFSLVTLLAAASTAIIHVPNIIDLYANSDRSMGSFDKSQLVNNFNIFEILSRFFIGGHEFKNILSTFTPALYVTVLVPILVYFYFVNKNISRKEKIWVGSIVAILFLSIVFDYLNIVWHAFSIPNHFNYRFAFLFNLFFIYVASRNLFSNFNVDLKHYFIILISFLVVGIMGIIFSYRYISVWDIYITIALVVIYLLLLFLYGKLRDFKGYYAEKSFKMVSLLLGFMMIGELFFNFYISLDKYEFSFKNEYRGHVERISKSLENYLPKDNDFYRLEKKYDFAWSDSFIYNNYGVNSFLSTENNLNRIFFSNVGNDRIGKIVYFGYGNTEIVDSILGIKYYYDIKKTRPLYEEVDFIKFSRFMGFAFGFEEKDYPIVLNPYALSIGFMSDVGIKEFGKNFLKSGRVNYLSYQDFLMKTLTNTSDEYLVPQKIEKITDTKYRITLGDIKDHVYIKVPFNKGLNKNESVEIRINGEDVYEYSYSSTGLVFYINEDESSVLYLEMVSSNENIQIYFPFVYSLDYENFKKGIQMLKENQLNITYQDKNIIEGTVVVPENKKVMFTTIPYEKGWTIKANGKEVPYYKVIDSFIAFDLEPGEYKIEMKFMPPGLKLGVLISVISLSLLALYLVFEKKILNFINKYYVKHREIIDYLIVGGLTTVVSIVTYVIALKMFNINYVISTIISWILAVLFAYICSRVWVFKSVVNTSLGVLKEAYEFFKYRALSLLIDVGLMIILVSLFNIDDLISRIFVQIVIVIVNYVFSKYIIFKEKTS